MRDNKLRVIFVGALTQRKGISYLLEAVERLGPRVELSSSGSESGNAGFLTGRCECTTGFLRFPTLRY